MIIHHYTKAKTLPLILKNRTIRFSRADELDDDDEVPYRAARLDPRHYFVSSWASDTKGQAGLWHRYADLDRGVRLSLRAVPFDWTRLNVEMVRMVPDPLGGSEPKHCGFVVDGLDVPIDEAAVFGNGYVVHPMSCDLRNTFGGPVHYVDDPVGVAAKMVTQRGDALKIHGDGTGVARVKGRDWEDQHEYRFVLSAVCGPKLDYASDPVRYREAFLDMMEARAKTNYLDFYSEVRHIDVRLGAQSLVGMTVTLGPAMSSADRAMVREAVRELAPSATVVESTLKVRRRL